jgi:hypothetical protein
LNILIKKIEKKISALIFFQFLVIKTLDLDPDPDPLHNTAIRKNLKENMFNRAHALLKNPLNLMPGAFYVCAFRYGNILVFNDTRHKHQAFGPVFGRVCS